MKNSVGSSVAVAVSLVLITSSATADEPHPQAPSPPPRELAAATAPQPAPPVSPIPAPTAEEIRRRRVIVHIDSGRPSTVVERRVSVKEENGAFLVLPFRATDATWEQICVTPCQVDLDRYSTYRISAQNGVSRSYPFTLPQKADALHLNIDARSLVAHRVGQTFTVAGIAAMIVGGSLLVAASDFRHPSDARIAGGTTGGVGVVLTAIGIPLALTTVSRLHNDNGQDVAKVYNNHGYALPLLPDIKLSKTFTLTQRGITF